MKNFYWVAIVLLFGLVACDNSGQETAVIEDMAVDAAVNMDDAVIEEASGDTSLITPGDMPEEAQAVLYQTVFDYNQCMMTGRLNANQDGQHVQQAANDIMNSCETHIDSLKELLVANKVNDDLVIGMTKKMRSRAARKLMTQSMNAMQAQAMAVENADQMKAE
ncbi:MAG: hypothetical protein ACKE9I_09815 [Methylophagaceae bacterium]